VNYDGTPGMTVSRIKREAELAAKIAAFLDQHPSRESALVTLTDVRNWLWTREGEKWAFVPEPAPILGPAPSPFRAILPVFASAVTTLLWPFLLSAVIAFIAAWWAGGIVAGLCIAALLAAAAAVAEPRWPFLAAAVISLALG
jgi:hypothetical protein